LFLKTFNVSSIIYGKVSSGNKHHTMKTCRGMEVKVHTFLKYERREISSQLHSPVTLAPGKQPQVAMSRKLGVLETACGSGDEGKNS
jgi:hypothetical protein